MLTAQQKHLLRLPHLSTKSTFPASTILLKSMFPMSPSVIIILYLLSDDAMPVFVRERMLILLKNFDQKKFKEYLAQAPWSIIESFDNPSDALDTWYKIYNSIVDLHFPGCVKRIKSPMLPKWIDKSILASIRTRNRLKKRGTNAASWLEYKTYRNKVTFQIKKQIIFKDALESHSMKSQIYGFEKKP